MDAVGIRLLQQSLHCLAHGLWKVLVSNITASASIHAAWDKHVSLCCCKVVCYVWWGCCAKGACLGAAMQCLDDATLGRDRERALSIVMWPSFAFNDNALTCASSCSADM